MRNATKKLSKNTIFTKCLGYVRDPIVGNIAKKKQYLSQDVIDKYNVTCNNII